MGPEEPGMSNYLGNYQVDEGLDELLKSEKVVCRHSGWEFHGYVWWDPDEQMFVEEVWQDHEPVAEMKAPTLPELMEKVGAEFGTL